jgi:hypothetical protein
MLYLCTTIIRDGLVRDVTIEFTAECTLAASRACWDDPGYDAEYEATFVGAALDFPEPDDHGLTEAEMATVQSYFHINWDKASEAANDNGWRGLEA